MFCGVRLAMALLALVRLSLRLPVGKLKLWTAGDEIVVVIQKARPIPQGTAAGSAAANKVRRGDVRRAVVVRTKKETRRPDGRWIRFDDNAAVLLNNKVGIPCLYEGECAYICDIQRELLGTRINSVVAAELRQMGWSRICSLAPKVA